MAAASVNGITLEYDVHGAPDADPLLLVMGLGGQLIGWPIGFVEALIDRGFRVIRFDNRDIGLSTKVDAPAPTKRQMMLGLAGAPLRQVRPTRWPTWPTMPPASSTTSTSTGRTSWARRWAG